MSGGKRKLFAAYMAAAGLAVSLFCAAGAYAAQDESAGSQAAGQAETQGIYPVEFETAGWKIAVENVQISESLENISVSLGYSGVETSSFVKEAQDGSVFCMIKLLIEKQGSKEAIEWEQMLLTDAEGNEYQRLADEFILDLGMKRMPGTKLNFGSSEGWIAYEIPEDAQGLVLSYDFAEEKFSFAFPEDDATESTTESVTE